MHCTTNSSSRRQSDAGDEKDIKQRPTDGKEDHVYEEEDIELSTKKDRPPRFSTLFEGTTPAPPQITERYVEQPRRKKSGVYIPMPLFVVLAIVLFFESTLLFAYTIIGLYNNMPNGVLPFGPTPLASEVVGGCQCGSGNGQAAQGAINIAPNFYLAGAPQAVETTSASVAVTSSSSTSSTTSSTSSTTSSKSTSSHTAPSSSSSPTSSSSSTTSANETPFLLSLLGALHTDAAPPTTSATPNPLVASTTKIVIATPKGKVVSVTLDETVVAGQKTSTAFTTVNAKRTSGAKNGGGDAAAKETTMVTKTSSSQTTSAPSPTTTEAAKTKDKAAKAETSTTSTEAVGGACFGAGGAVWQNCVQSLR